MKVRSARLPVTVSECQVSECVVVHYQETVVRHVHPRFSDQTLNSVFKAAG